MSTTPPNDEDPRGYNFAPQDQPIDGGSGQGNVVDYRGTEQAQEYSDLESMYSKSSTGAEERIARRAKMDAPPEKKGVSGCAMTIIALLVALGGGVAFMFIGERDGFNEDGDLVKMSYVNYYKSRFGGSERVKAFYGMDPLLRSFMITKERIEEIWGFTEIAAKAARKPRTLDELVAEKVITKNKTKDGWGNEFEITSGLNVRVISGGPDGRIGTSDDISIGESGLKYPVEFDGMLINETGSF